MKHFITLFVSLLLLIVPINTNAQSKVAHINTQQLISEMPEVIAAQSELKKLEDQYAKELETSAKEFQTKAQSYQGDAQNQTELINQQRQVELQEMQQRIQGPPEQKIMKRYGWSMIKIYFASKMTLIVRNLKDSNRKN